MAKNIIGKSRAEMMTAGWRTVRSTERCASAAIWMKSNELILRLRLLGPLARALERASCLLQEHVIQGRLVEPQVRDLEALGVQGAHHVGEVSVVEADGDGAGLGGDLLAEASQRLRDGGALPGVRGGRLDAGAPDLGLQRLRRVLRDDAAPVYDPDPVRQHVGLLQVLGRQEHRHPILARQTAHLRPHGAAALGVEARRRLVQKQDARPVHQGEREVQPPLHPAGVTAHPPVRGLREPDALQELSAPLFPLCSRQAVQSSLEPQVVAAGEERVEGGLLQRRPYRGAHLRPLLHDVVAGDARGAARGRQERREHQYRRGLAGPVRTEEAVDLSLPHGEAYAVYGPGPLPELPDEVLYLDAAPAAHHLFFSLTLVKPPLSKFSLRNPQILRRNLEVGELLADLPQPLLRQYVVGLLVRRDDLAIRQVPPGHLPGLG